jgi:hypothetical protein
VAGRISDDSNCQGAIVNICSHLHLSDFLLYLIHSCVAFLFFGLHFVGIVALTHDFFDISPRLEWVSIGYGQILYSSFVIEYSGGNGFHYIQIANR